MQKYYYYKSIDVFKMCTDTKLYKWMQIKSIDNLRQNIIL